MLRYGACGKWHRTGFSLVATMIARSAAPRTKKMSGNQEGKVHIEEG